MAANLQIFMTNTASHCKGMWNLCVISALKKKQFISCRRRANICPFQQKITWQRHSPWSQYVSVFKTCNAKGKSVLGKVIRFFTVSTSRSRLEHLCVLTDRQKKKHWDFSTFWSERAAWHLRCLSFYEKWKLRHLWPTFLSEDVGR